MIQRVTSIRGMHDILPEETQNWLYLEQKMANVFEQYGYEQIRTPLIEKTNLFKRSIGEVTDIVEKEMYTFLDRNGESLTLRPEGTAGCVRSGIEHGLFYNQMPRLWYMGPMFRHERPQKGRYRQFFQVGAELFGMSGPSADAEIILLTSRIWQALGLDSVRLEINTLGTMVSRLRYQKELKSYLYDHMNDLDPDSQSRLDKNCLRILDSKDTRTQEVLKDAPVLLDYLDESSREHFMELEEILRLHQCNYIINPRLVRGLDYYCETVFEWITDDLGAQGTVCAGGRYDGLVEQLGGKPTAACGFAMGMERLLSLLENQHLIENKSKPLVYILSVNTQARREALLIGEYIRTTNSILKVIVYCGDSGLKAQMKRADKSNAELVIIIDDQEMQDQKVTIKAMNQAENQITVPKTQIMREIERILNL